MTRSVFGHASGIQNICFGHRMFRLPQLQLCLLRPCGLETRLKPVGALSGTLRSSDSLPLGRRKVKTNRSRQAAALEVLRQVTHQATLPVPSEEPQAADGVLLRFPALEFRSLLTNAIGRDSFPDRAVWKRYKVELCTLLLHLAAGDSAAYSAALGELVASCMDASRQQQQAQEWGGRAGRRKQRSRASDAATPPAGTGGDAGGSGSGGGGSSGSGMGALSAAFNLAASSDSAAAGAPGLSAALSPRDGADWGAAAARARPAKEPTAAGASSAGEDDAPALTAQQQQETLLAARVRGANNHKRSLEARRTALRCQVDAWCRAIVDGAAALEALPSTASSPASLRSSPPIPSSSSSTSSAYKASAAVLASAASASAAAFARLRPLLERVIGMGEPAPLVDIRRNGSYTELQVAAQLEGHLPEGWRLYAQATIVRVDGAPFQNRKHLKGEADLLLVDPEGTVQALVEVKTAKGNPYVALYEDVGKLLGLLRAVRNRTVTFRHGASTELVTLAFSKRLRPIYILGCGGPSAGGLKWQTTTTGGAATAAATAAVPFAAAAVNAAAATAAATPQPAPVWARGGTAATASAAPSPSLSTSAFSRSAGSGVVSPPSSVLRSAWSKLLTMELGRELSGEAGPAAWSAVQVAALSREAVVLQVPPAAYPPLAQRVSTYFSRLAHCDVYLVNT